MNKFKKVLKIIFAIMLVSIVLSFDYGAFAENISGDENEDIAIDFTGKREGYASVIYDNTNGLPTSEANAIAETEEGFIWIGSYSGLIRYDGNTFERIDSTTGITSVVSLYTDSSNRLWIGTNDNGLAVMDRGKVKFYDYYEGLKSSSIRSIVEDDEGYMIIATTHGLGMIDKNLELHSIDETLLNDEYVCELRKAKDGIIYGETLSGAVFTIENRKITGYYDGKKLGINGINTIYPDPDNPGFVYLGTVDSEIYYGQLSGDNNFDKIDVSPLTTINSIEQFHGTIWVCSSNGAGVIENGKFEMIRNIPMNNSINHMLVDYQGNVWFTSNRQGVLKLVPNQFTDLYDMYDLSNEVVNSTCAQGKNIYIGTDTGLEVINDLGIVKNIKIKKMETSIKEYENVDNLITLFDEIRIRSIVKDSKDRLWFSTFSDLGLIMYDNGNVKIYGVEEGLPSTRIRTVIEREDGTYLVACGGGVAVLDEDGNVTEVFDERSGISNTELLTVCEGSNGDILVGSDGNGIYVINGNKIFNYDKEDGLGSGVVMRIKKDKTRDIYWIVTSNSIDYLQDGEIHTIEKFPYSNNFDLYENSNDEMWILSSNGIYVTPVEKLLENGKIEPLYYSRENGLPCVATANSYSDIQEDGTLYVAGVTGVVKVNIDSDFGNVEELKMSVPFIGADDEMVYPNEDGSFTINPNVKRLTIYPYVYTYSLINPIVTYQMKGFDATPTTVERTNLEPVDYTNLDGGTYTFDMSIKSSTGVSNKNVQVKITKIKATHEKTWFKVLVALLVLALITLIVVAYVKRKMKALLKKQEENKLFIREMIEAFAKTIDMKDKYTNGHSTRVAVYTAMLTKELGYDEETVEKYYNIALLHDIGKIGIPPEVLNKPGKLTDEEFNIIKSHSAKGYNALKDISIMPELAIGAGAHHERPDGKGYPKGLKEDEIPRVAQIIAVADTFDAMYSDRPYRKRMNFDKAVSIIKEVSGTQLTSDVVDAFVRLVEKGEFRAEDDDGGGTTEDINNIHEQQKRMSEQRKKINELIKEKKKEDEEK